MDLRREIEGIIEGEVASSKETLDRYSRDASLFEVRPSLVVLPRNVADILALVSYVSIHQNKKLSLTPRSGGTCMSGGPLSESIVVDVSKYLNEFVDIQDHTATAQPGMFYRDFEKRTLNKNMLLPSYPASRELCTIGGMVANNSGGEKTLALGKTEDYVQRLKVVLSDGNEYEIKSLTMEELEEKKKQNTFEGHIYRETHKLIESNHELIMNAKPRVSKDSTGYHLWNVWDKKRGVFDLTRLFTGSQGTLGIITEIQFRLVTPNPHTSMLVVFMPSLENLGRIIQQVLKYDPESFESYDDNTVMLALKFLPQMVKQMGSTNVLSLGLRFLPELKLLLTGGLPKLVLIAEFTGHDPKELQKRAKAAQSALAQFNVKTRVTRSEEEAEKYWTVRRESFNLLRNKVKDKHTAPFIDDLTVRPEKLPEFLPKLHEILKKYDINYTIAGHVGDGNFHIIPLMDLTKENQRAIIPKLAEEVYALVFECKGSMSGEHNDGLIRSHYLPKMYGEEVYHLFEETKRIFDPLNIFNPGKKVGSDWEWAKEHILHDW